MLRHVSLLCVGLMTMGCAAATSAGRPVMSAGRDVITAAEIVAARVTDAYQAVAQLRPEFLRRRSTTPIQSVGARTAIVYLDDIEFGPIESLRQVPLGRVRLIRYLSPNEADLRWGRQHPAGAIQVTTMR